MLPIFDTNLGDSPVYKVHRVHHGLWTPHEVINQRNLKIWADVADKICFGRTQQLGMGVNFRPCSDGDFPTGRA